MCIDDLHLLQAREHKDCSLTHTRLGLAENIGTKDGLGNALLLDCTGQPVARYRGNAEKAD